MFKLFEDEYRFHIIQIKKISKDIFIEKERRNKDIFQVFLPFQKQSILITYFKYKLIPIMITIYSHDGVLDPVDYKHTDEQTIADLFQKFFQEYEVSQELNYDPSPDQIVIVYYNQQTKKVDPQAKVTQVLKQNGEPLQLLAVYPSEQGSAIIQFLVNGKDTYFQNTVNKSHTLDVYLKKLVNKIKIQGQLQIKVNGENDDEDSPFEKKLIKNILDSNDKITVQINVKEKQKKKQANAEEKAEPKPKRNEKKQEQKRKEEQHQQGLESKPERNKINGNRPKPDKKQSKKEEKKEEKQNERKIKEEEKKQPKKKVQEAPKPPKKEQQKPREQKYEIIFKFQSDNDEERSILRQVSPSQTMLSLLPKVLESIVSIGFDWDMTWDEYSDKLVIFHQRLEYRSFDKKFKQVFAEVNKKRLNLTIKRRYDGG